MEYLLDTKYWRHKKSSNRANGFYVEIDTYKEVYYKVWCVHTQRLTRLCES